MKFFKLLSLVFISLALFACSVETADRMSSKNSVSQNITISQIQKKWQLESIDGTPVRAEINSTLAVDAQGQATGRLACNNFFGRLELKDNMLKIEQMGSTRMLCAGIMNRVEMIVSSVLNNGSEI
ncbi:MAG: heat shock protein HslJ, partial [Sphingobacteriales bacterium]